MKMKVHNLQSVVVYNYEMYSTLYRSSSIQIVVFHFQLKLKFQISQFAVVCTRSQTVEYFQSVMFKGLPVV